MSSRAHWGNRTKLLSLIVIASHMNPLGKLGNKVKYLTSDEQRHVIENIQPEGVDTSLLTESIQNFKQNALTLDFLHGLFDGDGSLSVSLVKSSKVSDSGEDKNRVSLKVNFTIVQDEHNLSLLDEIKNYFNGEGHIYGVNSSNKYGIYNTGSRSVLHNTILPKMMGKETYELLNSSDLEDVRLPLIKYNKISCTYKILEYGLLDIGSAKEEKEKMGEIIKLIYYVRKDEKLTFEEYKQKMYTNLGLSNL